MTILTFVTLDGKIQKITRGHHPRAQGVLVWPPFGAVLAGAECDFKILPSIVTNVKILSKKVGNTQPNPPYSHKNNVAICMISPFIA